MSYHDENKQIRRRADGSINLQYYSVRASQIRSQRVRSTVKNLFTLTPAA
jgi:hypothetical protein